MDDEQRPQQPEGSGEPTQHVPSAGPAIPPMPAQQVVYVTQQPVTNGMATAALVCGIVALVLFWTVWLGLILGVLAVVFGALGRTKAAQGAPNKAQATAGLWLGIAALVVSILFVGLVTSWVTSRQGPIFDQVERCMDNPDAC